MAISHQLRHVVRRLRRAPLFTSVTVATLAIAIGANTAIFSVLDGVLLKPLPYSHPEELVGVWHTAPGINIAELNSSPSLYFTYREDGRTFQDVGLWVERSATVTGLAEPRASLGPAGDGRSPAPPGRASARRPHRSPGRTTRRGAHPR